MPPEHLNPLDPLPLTNGSCLCLMTMTDPNTHNSSDSGNERGSAHRGQGGLQALFPSVLGPVKQEPGNLEGKTAVITGGMSVHEPAGFRLW